MANKTKICNISNLILDIYDLYAQLMIMYDNYKVREASKLKDVQSYISYFMSYLMIQGDWN